MKRWSPAPVLLLVMVLSAACDYLPPMPQNPFRVTPTVEEPTPTAAAVVLATAVPTATQPAFTPYWVKNFRPTEMWSGPPGQAGVISFGTTSSQFCSFQVMEQQTSARLHVLNPYSKDYFWIDADAVGPVQEQPQRLPGPKPPDQNCAEAIYDG